MRIYVLLLAVLIAAFSAGCTVKPKTVAINTEFDESQAKRQLLPGKNTIQGNAFMRLTGGDVVTCAGSDVGLTPATAYATERMKALYGNDSSGFRPDKGRSPLKFAPDSQEYYQLTKKTVCDSQGIFTFENIADGDFYVFTKVTWNVGGYIPQGGTLMQKVHVANGQTKKIILSK